MRVFQLFLFTLVLAAVPGCNRAPKQNASAQPREKQITTQVAPEQPPRFLGNNATPVQVIQGQVISVNARLRFVIIEFGNNPLPQLEQKLNVYRIGQKVAEIKISGPYRNSTVAADITAGEVNFGDMVSIQ